MNVQEIKYQLDGTYMNVIKFGSGKKNMVMISGMSLSGLEGQGEAIAAAYSMFAEDFTVYLFERRKAIPEDFGVPQMAEDICRALEWLSVGSAYFFGVSQGGMIAQYIAVNHPKPVLRMALGSSSPRPDENSRAVMNRWAELCFSEDIRALNHDMFTTMYSKDYYEKYREIFDGMEDGGTPEDRQRFAVLCRATRDFDIFDRLKEIKCPVLVVGAGGDRVLGVGQSRAIAGALGCGMYLYPDTCGHTVYDEAEDYKMRIYNFFNDREVLL